MNELFDNGVVEWVLALLVAIFVLGVFGWLKFKRDEKVVADFLKTSGLEERPRLKTTEEISLATKLHVKRVRRVCRKSTRIKKEQDGSWKFHG